MARRHRITINGRTIEAREGELLLDAALSNGVDLPYDCRAGHCGTCCMRLVSGDVDGGRGAEPGIVHACKCRIVADAELDKGERDQVRAVSGQVTSLRALSHDVWQLGITTSRALPYRPGQYVQLGFEGFPSRPFSLTLPICGEPEEASLWFHIRSMTGGSVTHALGDRITFGHEVTVKGPYGAAHFRPHHEGRLVLVATNTGFAPIWSIAVAALRENPRRPIMVIAGGRELSSLYMGPALVRLANFPNVRVVAACSTPQSLYPAVRYGRPTAFLPSLLPSDVVYVCGVPAMVEAVKEFAAGFGATCHADPFVPASRDEPAPKEASARLGIVTRTKTWLFDQKPRSRRKPATPDRIEPELSGAWLTKG